MLLNEVFEKEVSKKPDHLFSEFEGKKITYNEANIIANNLETFFFSLKTYRATSGKDVENSFGLFWKFIANPACNFFFITNEINLRKLF